MSFSTEIKNELARIMPEKECCQLAEIFKDSFRLEVQYHDNAKQKEHNEKVLALYRKYGWPLFFATDSHYVSRADRQLRRELQLSAHIDMDDSDWDLFLPTAEEAFAIMQRQGVLSRAQIEEAMENTLILREFEGFSYNTARKFPISRPDLTPEQRNRLYQRMVCEGYIERAGMPNKEEAAALHEEMDTVVDTGSADYFIGLHDMVKRGQELGGVLTTTSRGSACSFASNYALGFTSINRLHTPVRMYPERFVSKAKLVTSMPDIDCNIANLEAFEQAGREIFGEHGCYPMIAYGTCKTLSAFKLLARARDLDFDTSNAISKQLGSYEMDLKHARENNQDDPDYDPSEDVRLEDYIEPQYRDLVRESAQYRGIITSISPHPCAHLVYHEDIESEIGIIRVKSKSGNKEPVFCACIDGATADAAGYCKIDLLRVDVVKVINDTFAALNRPVMTADELIAAVKDDPKVWKLYADGYTMGLNQTEKPKTTERAMLLRPKNTVELSAFVAAIRPGAKTLVDDYVNRTKHVYGIPAMDDLLRLRGATGTTGESAFLFYDEQILTLAQAAGIEPADAYALTKAIKKKKLEKVAAYKDKFIPGFVRYLKEKQGTDETLAESTAQDVWSVILNSASYLFCAAHAYAMCLDSLYGAYLKSTAPYEFYTVLLKLYTEKGNKEKIALIVDEMRRYAGIALRAGRFGEDNRDWYVNREAHTISQSLSSIKYISAACAEELYLLGQRHFDTFTDLLDAILTETSINARQIDALISLGYFSAFGGRRKLRALVQEFREGKNRITKTLKRKQPRIEALRALEAETEDADIPIEEAARLEDDLLGMCVSSDANCPPDRYIATEIDDKYSIKVRLYSLRRSSSGWLRVRKNDWNDAALKEGDCICLDEWQRRPKYRYSGGKRAPVNGENELWMTKWHVLNTAEGASL